MQFACCPLKTMYFIRTKRFPKREYFLNIQSDLLRPGSGCGPTSPNTLTTGSGTVSGYAAWRAAGKTSVPCYRRCSIHRYVSSSGPALGRCSCGRGPHGHHVGFPDQADHRPYPRHPSRSSSHDCLLDFSAGLQYELHTLI